MPTVLDRLRQLASHVDVVTPSAELDSSQADQPTNLGFKLGNFAIDDYRPMKIIVIGAGMSGILAGIRYLLCLSIKIDSTHLHSLIRLGFVNTFKALL